MKAIFIAFSIIAINLKLAECQCRQQQNILMNRIPEAIIEAPRNFNPPQMAMPYSIDYKKISHLAPKVLSAPSTTIITDCSPSVCKNLADTLQLMTVCNLLEGRRAGSDLALQLASPLIKEAISSPSFSCGCPNPLYQNLPQAPNFARSAVINTVPANTCPKPSLLHILGLLNN